MLTKIQPAAPQQTEAHQLGEFKLVGLAKPNSFTCTPLNSDELFWATSNFSAARFIALFAYCKNNWDTPKRVKIQHDGLSNDGTPRNPVVVEFFEVSE